MRARSARSYALLAISPRRWGPIAQMLNFFIAHSLIAGILLWRKTWAFTHIYEDLKIAAESWVANSLANFSHDEDSKKIVTNLHI